MFRLLVTITRTLGSYRIGGDYLLKNICIVNFYNFMVQVSDTITSRAPYILLVFMFLLKPLSHLISIGRLFQECRPSMSKALSPNFAVLVREGSISLFDA